MARACVSAATTVCVTDVTQDGCSVAMEMADDSAVVTAGSWTVHDRRTRGLRRPDYRRVHLRPVYRGPVRWERTKKQRAG